MRLRSRCLSVSRQQRESFTSSVCVCNSRPPSSRLLEGREHGLTIIGDALPISGSRGADLGGGRLAVKSNSTCVPTAPSDHTSLATLNCSGLRRLDCSRPEQGNAARGASKGPRPDFRNASGQRMHRDRKLGGRAAPSASQWRANCACCTLPTAFAFAGYKARRNATRSCFSCADNFVPRIRLKNSTVSSSVSKRSSCK